MANKTPKAADVPEVLPQTGGSYVRNDDGTLTQTEGMQAAVSADPLPNPLPQAGEGTNVKSTL